MHSLAPELLHKLMTEGNLAGLTLEQKTAYYAYRCKLLDLDPATQPFDLINLQGKLTLYAKKECSSQLASKRNLSVTIPAQGPQGDIYVVQARVKGGDGRETDDLGAVSIKGKAGDDLCNAMMKAATKAKRRAILTHCGLGMLDESELETIRGKWGDSGSKEQAAEVAERKLREMQDADLAAIEAETDPQFVHKPIPGVINEVMASWPDGTPLAQPQPSKNDLPAAPQGRVVPKISSKRMEQFQAAKKAIGEAAYYQCLNRNGYNKSNQVPTEQEAKKILAEMGKLAKALELERAAKESNEASLICAREGSGCSIPIANQIAVAVKKLKLDLGTANLKMQAHRDAGEEWETILLRLEDLLKMEGK